MSYERQNSTSRLQLYRERKVERMAAMRRAIDEGRTTVVSSDSVSVDESPIDAPVYYCSVKPLAEMKTCSDHLISDATLAALEGYYYGLGDYKYVIRNSILAAFHDRLNKVRNEKRQSYWIHDLNSIQTLGHPNTTARLVSEALHDRTQSSDKKPAYKVLNYDNRVFLVVGNEPEAQSDYIGIVSGGQWSDAIQQFDLSYQYVRTISGLSSESNKIIDRRPFQEKRSTYKNK